MDDNKIENGTLTESVFRANTHYEIYRDASTGLMVVYADGSKVGQTQTLAGARLIRRNHARNIERNYR